MTEFKCPQCGMVSHHPDDVINGYCGNCHAFTRDAPAAMPEVEITAFGDHSRKFIDPRGAIRMEPYSTNIVNTTTTETSGGGYPSGGGVRDLFPVVSVAGGGGGGGGGYASGGGGASWGGGSSRPLITTGIDTVLITLNDGTVVDITNEVRAIHLSGNTVTEIDAVRIAKEKHLHTLVPPLTPQQIEEVTDHFKQVGIDAEVAAEEVHKFNDVMKKARKKPPKRTPKPKSLVKKRDRDDQVD